MSPRRLKTAPPVEHLALYDRLINAVIADGGWRDLLPLPIDGLLLVPSRSEEYADHEVRMQGRHVLSCTGRCGAHPACFHRVKAAVASWQHEHPGWEVTAVREGTGAVSTPLILALIREYLTPPKVRPGAWTHRLDHSHEPERAIA